MFDDYYEPIYSYTFDASSTPPRAICRPVTVRQCWSCGKKSGDQDVRFSKEAHVIPAAFGNRSLFSLEECDDCNESSGEGVEMELADYLTLARAISRIRTRKGSFKYRFGKNQSFIAGRPDQNQLEVEIHDGESSLQLIQVGDRELELRLTVPPSNPVSAAKALARMAYFTMHDDDRARNAHVKDWVLGKVSYLPTFFEAFLPGTGQRLVALRVFRLRPNAKDKAPYLVQFDYGSITLILPLPTADLMLPNADLLPEIPTSPYPPHVPSIIETKCLKDDIIPRRVETTRIAYQTKIELAKVDPHSDPGSLVDAGRVVMHAQRSEIGTIAVHDVQVPVRFLCIGRGGAILFDVVATVLRVATGPDLQLVFGDRHGAWSVDFVVTAEKARAETRFADYCGLGLDAVRDLLRVQKAIREAARLELRSVGSHAPILWVETSGVPAGWDPSNVLEVYEALISIRTHTGVELTLPSAVDDTILRDIAWVASGVCLGEFKDVVAQRYDVPMNANSVAYLRENFANGRRPDGFKCSLGTTVEILGKQIDLGPIEMALENPLLVDDLEDVIRRLEAVEAPDAILIPFSASCAMYFFSKIYEEPYRRITDDGDEVSAAKVRDARRVCNGVCASSIGRSASRKIRRRREQRSPAGVRFADTTFLAPTSSLAPLARRPAPANVVG